MTTNEPRRTFTDTYIDMLHVAEDIVWTAEEKESLDKITNYLAFEHLGPADKAVQLIKFLSHLIDARNYTK